MDTPGLQHASHLGLCYSGNGHGQKVHENCHFTTRHGEREPSSDKSHDFTLLIRLPL